MYMTYTLKSCVLSSLLDPSCVKGKLIQSDLCTKSKGTRDKNISKCYCNRNGRQKTKNHTNKCGWLKN